MNTKYRYIKYLLIFIFVLCLCSCNKHHNTDINKTLLIYFAANNNLSSYAQDNIDELINDGYIPDYFDVDGSGDVLLLYVHLLNQSPKLLRLSKDSKGEIYEETIVEYESHNSMDSSVMYSVLNYAYHLFPGEENGLVLWSHGTGWLPKGYYSSSTSSFSGALSSQNITETEDADAYDYLVKSFGSDNGQEMNISALPSALPIKYSYIIFDACLMGGIEVAYELKDKADYQIISPAEILASGFPYTSMTQTLMGSSTALVDRLKSLCDNYYSFYNSGTSEVSRSATISLIRSYELEELAEKTKDILARDSCLISGLDMTQLQRFFRHNKHWFYDFEDFISQISTNTSELDEFEKQLTKAVVYKKATPYFMKGSTYGFEIKKFSGLSSYVPNPKNATLDAYYKGFAWNKAVGLVNE